MFRFILLCLLATLAGCANSQLGRYHQWAQDGLERVERGDLKWSAYYEGCFSRLLNVPDARRDKSPELEMYDALIALALAYEDGKLGKAEFDQKRRQIQMDYARKKEQGCVSAAHADTAGDIYPH